MVEGGVVDDVVRGSDTDAVRMTRRLWREEGAFAGVSSGTNVLVTKREAESDLWKTVVTILTDSGCRYLSEVRFVT
jgi:cysteine synthase